ncbi:MAG TPA: hypothetical protein VIJ00_15295 [Nakamurella sp.]
MMVETASALTSSAPSMAAAAWTVSAAASTEIRVGASSSRTSSAGGPSCRILPLSMIATRSQSDSASSM